MSFNKYYDNGCCAFLPMRFRRGKMVNFFSSSSQERKETERYYDVSKKDNKESRVKDWIQSNEDLLLTTTKNLPQTINRDPSAINSLESVSSQCYNGKGSKTVSSSAFPSTLQNGPQQQQKNVWMQRYSSSFITKTSRKTNPREPKNRSLSSSSSVSISVDGSKTSLTKQQLSASHNNNNNDIEDKSKRKKLFLSLSSKKEDVPGSPSTGSTSQSRQDIVESFTIIEEAVSRLTEQQVVPQKQQRCRSLSCNNASQNPSVWHYHHQANATTEERQATKLANQKKQQIKCQHSSNFRRIVEDACENSPDYKTSKYNNTELTKPTISIKRRTKSEQ